MRVAILSDIHGNQIALDAVLEDLAQQPAIEQIIVAGDLCLNGPRPRQVLETLYSLNCAIIQGNVDDDVVNGAKDKSSKKQSVIYWTQEQIGPEGIQYLAQLPLSHIVINPDTNGSDLLVVHANPQNQDEAIYPDASDNRLEELFYDLPSRIGAIAFGHYHVAYQRHWRNLLLVDAGSCGLPRDGDHRASYAILTWRYGNWQAEHRRVIYDLDKTIAQLRNCGIPNVDKRIKVLKQARY